MGKKHKIGEAWGDEEQPKNPEHPRVMSQNIDRIPINGASERSKRIFGSLSGQDGADVRLCQETGLLWNRLEKGQDWKARTKHSKGPWKVR